MSDCSITIVRSKAKEGGGLEFTREKLDVHDVMSVEFRSENDIIEVTFRHKYNKVDIRVSAVNGSLNVHPEATNSIKVTTS